MGTNYYARTTDDVAEGHEGLHIGKYSGGWDFLFQAHPDLGLNDCESWFKHLSQPGVEIYAESGYTIPLDEFWTKATARPADVGGRHHMRSHADAWGWRRDPSNQWTDSHGHPFAAYEFC